MSSGQMLILKEYHGTLEKTFFFSTKSFYKFHNMPSMSYSIWCFFTEIIHSNTAYVSETVFVTLQIMPLFLAVEKNNEKTLFCTFSNSQNMDINVILVEIHEKTKI